MNVQSKQELEIAGFNTLNGVLYKFSNAILVGQLLIVVCFIVYAGINYLFFPDYFWLQVTGVGAILLSIMSFVILFLTTATSLKKNDLIVIRKYRSGAGLISRTNIGRKSEILFDPKDPASKVTISWSGAITDSASGCKMIQLTEGNHINDNLNAQIAESEWDKDVARLTKAKSVADLAEAELFNQGLFGLKWQDILLIIIGIMCLATIGYLLMGAPDAIAKKTIEGLMDGTIQNAVTQGLANAGILTPKVA